MKKHGVLGITKKYVVSIIAWLFFGSSGLALAVEPRVFINNQAKSAGNDAAYWTAERLKNVQALPPPKPQAGFNLQQMFGKTAAVQRTEDQQAEVAYENGHSPTLNVKPNFTNRLFEPAPKSRAAPGSMPTPLDYGGLGAHYTSHRVFPLYTGDAWRYSADVAGPYRRVGKLFFTQPGVGDFVCSAAVIKPRVILTAGHCVHSGDGTSNGWFTNFLFIPTFRNGVAPYGQWNWSTVIVTGEWYSGGGTVPNTADYSVIAMTDSNGYRLGDVTGWFGWQTHSLHPNHVTILGYPCNLDSCQKMHRVDSESFDTWEPNTVVYGADMGGGASGGPWIHNFGKKSAGQSGGPSSGRNRVVGVTSYGPVDNGYMYLGSSVLDDRFVNILNLACNKAAGNC